MKRLGVYVVIALVLISAIGGFSTPQKSFAAVTQSQVDSVVAEAVTILNKPPVGQSPVLSPDDIKSYTTELQTIADNLLKSSDNNVSLTFNMARARLGSDFKDFLYSTPGHKTFQQGQEVFHSIEQTATNAVKADNGEITPGEASSTNARNLAEASSWKDNATANAKTGKCSFGFIGQMNLPACISEGTTWLIKNTLLEIAGFLVWLSANMLNYAIQIGVLGFSQWAPDTLYPIWVIVRQIVSLFIVFAGLWLGFMYIIGRDDKFKQYIPWVIIFALFVNFSYPLSRALIDVSNVVSLNIYSSAVGSEALTSDTGSKATAGAQIMDKLGLQGLVMSATMTNSSREGIVGNIDSVPGALLAVAFVLYAAYIFFMATAIIAVRTAILVFLIIGSPILFVDSVIPKLGDEAAKLRKMYFEQLIVAPVFMIMLTLTLKFLEVFKVMGSGAMGSAASSGSSASIVTFFNILMMLIMLHIMLKVTKSVSGTAGQMATNAMGKVGGFGLGVATGGAGFLARGTLGRAAASVRDSKWVTNNQDGIIGRHAYNMTNSLATSTYDARNTNMIGGRMSKIGMGMGAGTKMGYEAEREYRDKDRVERYDRTGTHRKNVYGTNGTLLHKKGDKDADNDEAKKRYYENAGGVIFGKSELRTKMGDQEKLQKDEVLSKYNNLEDVSKQELFNKQNKDVQDKLIAQDLKLARAENRDIDTKQERKETRDINKSLAESQKELAKSMQGLGDIKNKEQRTNPLPSEYATTPSGVIIPKDFDMNTQSFAERVAKRGKPENTKIEEPSPTDPKSTTGESPKNAPEAKGEMAA